MFVIFRNMVFLTVLLCAVIGISTAHSTGPISSAAIVGKLSERYYPLTDDDQDVAEDVALLLDHFRTKMHKGVYPVPSIDPYHRAILRPIIFNGINSPLTGTLNLYNVNITGLKEHSVDLIEPRLKTSRLDFNMSVPSLLVEVDYDANFLDKEFSKIDIGHMRILLKNVQVIGASTLEKTITKDRKFYVPVGLGLDIIIQECDMFIDAMKVTVHPTDFTKRIVDVVTHSVTEELMEHVKEILYLLPG